MNDDIIKIIEKIDDLTDYMNFNDSPASIDILFPIKNRSKIYHNDIKYIMRILFIKSHYNNEQDRISFRVGIADTITFNMNYWILQIIWAKCEKSHKTIKDYILIDKMSNCDEEYKNWALSIMLGQND